MYSKNMPLPHFQLLNFVLKSKHFFHMFVVKLVQRYVSRHKSFNNLSHKTVLRVKIDCVLLVK